jgi:hypothetical protein
MAVPVGYTPAAAQSHSQRRFELSPHQRLRNLSAILASVPGYRPASLTLQRRFMKRRIDAAHDGDSGETERELSKAGEAIRIDAARRRLEETADRISTIA